MNLAAPQGLDSIQNKEDIGVFIHRTPLCTPKLGSLCGTFGSTLADLRFLGRTRAVTECNRTQRRNFMHAQS